MGSIGAPEILVVLVVALIVLGPHRLPEAARQMGRALAELRRMSAGFQAEIRDATQGLDTAGLRYQQRPPVPPVPQPPRPTDEDEPATPADAEVADGRASA